jgi:hypothetical protein
MSVFLYNSKFLHFLQPYNPPQKLFHVDRYNLYISNSFWLLTSVSTCISFTAFLISSDFFPIKMNSFAMIFGLAFIAVVAAHGGSSYVKRTDHHGHHTEVSHGHHGGDGGHGHGGDEGHGHGHGGHGGHESHDYYHHPSYKYEYGVKDPKTKDHHSQWEHRDGDVVKGEYTLDEADGTKRVVKYSSDKKSGFTAHVERIGHAEHPHGHHGHH